MSDLAWHYTIGAKMQAIFESKQLRPATAYVPKHEKPVTWFSTHPHWEPTANKAMQDRVTGARRGLTMIETVRHGGGGWRFGMPIAELLPFDALVREAGMSRKTRRSLEAAGEQQGADPAQWFGVIGPVDIARCTLECLRDGEWIAAPAP